MKRRFAACVVAAAGCSSAPVLAQTAGQGLMPAYGTDVRVGDLRQQFARTFDTNPPTPTDRQWTLSPAIDVTQAYDSGVQHGSSYGHDFITRITPIIAATAQTNRLQGTLNYSPQFSIYAYNGSNTGIAHNLNAQGTATLVEDLLFADLRGYAATQPLLGGLSSQSSGRTNDVQSASFSAGPRLQKRFGDTATLQAGYSLSRNMMSSLAPRGSAPLVAGVNSNYTANSENASVSTGPDFGRITASLAAMATQYVGAGIYKGAYNDSTSLSAGYAVTRAIALTSSVGHETIVYGPGGPRTIDDITWSGGLRLTPNADSTISLSYGHQQGGTSFAFDGSYAPLSRLRLLARYSQGIGTGLQNLQGALSGAGVGPAGIAVDRTTNAPLNLNSLLGQQPGVYRTTSGSITAALEFDRDTYTLGFESTDRQLISSPSTTSGGIGSNAGITNSLAWQHAWSEALSSTTSVQYGTRSVPGGTTGSNGGSSETEAANAAVTYALSPTLSTNALISHTQTKGKSFGTAPVRDMALVGMHKAF